ncbi:SDR family oxidoreductase [Parvularcula oceani]|uniref:SDR family oxidoreductase n=1 Tax=Parvularcula oceani TaxID=1247963 RepID=UPI0004E1E614|nr:SDR family oxidoreductase [Parvularcula oceani]
MAKSKDPQFTMRDPRTAYPQPPFPKQPQDAPGTIAKMDPAPDHGEDSYVGSGRLKGRKALITGGDSGIGRAVAIAYAREGARVCVNYLEAEEEDAQSLKSLIEGEGGEITLMPGDLMDQAFCEGLVSKAADAMDGLDILVINAGKQVRQDDVQDISAEQFDQTMKTNVYAMFWMARAALRLMPPGSAIITTTSIQGFSPSPALLDYATTKFAIRGFTEALAQTAIEQGIRVNGIAPGPFWTPLQPSGGQSQEKVHEFGSSTPMKRPGQPAEIAPAYVYLASGESSYVAGEILGLTGGKPIS